VLLQGKLFKRARMWQLFEYAAKRDPSGIENCRQLNPIKIPQEFTLFGKNSSCIVWF